MTKRTFTPNPDNAQGRIDDLYRSLDPLDEISTIGHLGPDALTHRPTVYVVQRHVAKSGAYRLLSLFIIENGRLRNITLDAAVAMGERITTDRFGDFTIAVRGSGMDMHFHTVYRLSRALFGHVGIGDAGYIIEHRTL